MPASPRTRTTAARDANGPLRAIYDGTRMLGHVAQQRDGTWRAVARGGQVVGFLPSQREAVQAVMRHASRPTEEAAR